MNRELALAIAEKINKAVTVLSKEQKIARDYGTGFPNGTRTSSRNTVPCPTVKTSPNFFLRFSGKGAISFDESEFPVNPNIRYRFLRDGEIIDLGGRTLTGIPIRGHIQGSIGYLDSGYRSFFAGDCGNPSTFLFGKSFGGQPKVIKF